VTETPDERELADALRDVIGAEAARAVAAKVALLRHELTSRHSPRGRVWWYVAALDSPGVRKWRAELARRSKRIASAADELAALVGDPAELLHREPAYLEDLAAFRVAQRPDLAPELDLAPSAGATAGELLAAARANYLQRVEARAAARGAALRELLELAERVRDLAQLAERHAAARAPRVKPGPRADVFREALLWETVSAMSLAGIRIGTGERSPAVIALETVLRWCPMSGDARQLLRDMKKSKVWPLLTGQQARDTGG
jgi:hypothetical protein